MNVNDTIEKTRMAYGELFDINNVFERIGQSGLFFEKLRLLNNDRKRVFMRSLIKLGNRNGTFFEDFFNNDENIDLIIHFYENGILPKIVFPNQILQHLEYLQFVLESEYNFESNEENLLEEMRTLQEMNKEIMEKCENITNFFVMNVEDFSRIVECYIIEKSNFQNLLEEIISYVDEKINNNT